MSWTATLAHGLAEHIAAGIGTYRPTGIYRDDETGIVIGAVPASPARLLVLTLYPLADDVDQADSALGLQVRERSATADPRELLDLVDTVFDVLHGAPLWSRWAKTRTAATSTPTPTSSRRTDQLDTAHEWRAPRWRCVPYWPKNGYWKSTPAPPAHPLHSGPAPQWTSSTASTTTSKRTQRWSSPTRAEPPITTP
ncbi:hypothetical protein DMH04_53475 [Kibdelosporangium aridum]|uniref:Uncharacterized protein n=1 Tax=Kibdelosporangium aridum TaxID=2030 RepID=A0A428Y2Y2_KIBAR|nr:minor capsid protein [Kibdelosporangium aridum]RSM61921.1 hypothetical protein DMH04_53475 [Kibdelosporangium aridum]